MRTTFMLAWAAVLIGILSFLVWQKEQTVSSGRTVLLELLPRDPRSIMQGDYMVLRYKLASDVKEAELKDKGRLVLKLDDKGVGSFARLDDGGPVAADEAALIYRKRKDLRIGAESYLFQEGDADLYNRARYGELKVDGAGSSVLIGLRDQDLAPMGRPVVQ